MPIFKNIVPIVLLTIYLIIFSFTYLLYSSKDIERNNSSFDSWIRCAEIQDYLQSDGLIFLGCEGGVLVFDEESGTLVRQISSLDGLEGGGVTALLLDRENLLVGTRSGVFVFELDGSNSVRRIEEFEGKQIFSMADAGDVLVFGLDGEIAVLEKGDYKVKKIVGPDFASIDFFAGATEMVANEDAVFVYFGSSYSPGVLFRYDLFTDVWINYEFDVENLVVNELALTEGGILVYSNYGEWLATAKGTAVLVSEKTSGTNTGEFVSELLKDLPVGDIRLIGKVNENILLSSQLRNDLTLFEFNTTTLELVPAGTFTINGGFGEKSFNIIQGTSLLLFIGKNCDSSYCSEIEVGVFDYLTGVYTSMTEDLRPFIIEDSSMGYAFSAIAFDSYIDDTSTMVFKSVSSNGVSEILYNLESLNIAVKAVEDTQGFRDEETFCNFERMFTFDKVFNKISDQECVKPLNDDKYKYVWSSLTSTIYKVDLQTNEAVELSLPFFDNRQAVDLEPSDFVLYSMEKNVFNINMATSEGFLVYNWKDDIWYVYGSKEGLLGGHTYDFIPLNENKILAVGQDGISIVELHKN